MIAWLALLVAIASIGFGSKILFYQKALEMNANEMGTRIACIIAGLFCLYLFLERMGIITK